MTNRWRSVVTSPGAALVLALAAGCSKDAPRGSGTAGGNLTTATAVANGSSFSSPFDAAPSPDGNTVYFTGIDPATGAAIFKVPAAGGTPTVLASGCATPACDAFVGAPFGLAVASDGSKVFVADPAYVGGASDSGAIFSVPSGGGSQTVLSETSGYAPRFVTVGRVGGSDNLYFIGNDKDGTPSIFKDANGAVTTVLKGGDPQAVAVSGNGTVYYVDQNGTVQKLAAGGTAGTALGAGASNLALSYPVGLALSHDESSLLVPVIDPAKSTQAIARIDSASGVATLLGLNLPATNSEGGGFHKAANADVYSFVDSGAGSTGTIYVLK